MLQRPPALRVLLAAVLAASPLLSAAPAYAAPEVGARVEVPSARVVVAPASLSLPGAALSLPNAALPSAAIPGAAVPSAPASALAAPAPLPASAVAAAPRAPAAAAPVAAAPAYPAPGATLAANSPENARTLEPQAASDERQPRTVLGRLAALVRKGLAASVFDAARAPKDEDCGFGCGILTAPAQPHDLLPGVVLNKKPRRTDEGAVRTSRFHLDKDQANAQGDRPIVLDADPNDPAAVEKALMALVDSDPKTFGASSADMAKVHVQLIPGDKDQGQADTYYAVFRQWKKGTDRDGRPYYLLVDGGSLTFVVKVLDGKPVVMAAEGRLFPGVESSIMTPSYSDAQLVKLASDRLRKPLSKTPAARLKNTLARIWLAAKRAARKVQDTEPELITRQITNVEGAWRAVNIYRAEDLKGRPVIVAVDINTGESWAWSAQDLLRGATAQLTGVAMARGTTLDKKGSDHGPTDAMPLAFANVYDQDGKVVARTDADGRFVVPDGAFKLTVRLEGAYAALSDDDSKNGTLEATLTETVPGQPLRAVINPTGDDEELNSDVNGYIYYSRQVAWLAKEGGVTDPRILAPLDGGVRANRTDMPGNAYFSPTDDSLNLQRRATIAVKGKNGQKRQLVFENTAQPSIIYHESTHRAVHVLSQIALSAAQAAAAPFRFVSKIMDPVMDGGVNEAIADTVSMFMRGSPLIGEGFILNMPPGRPNLIRTGANDTKFDPKDPDPHGQGEAFMGFTWQTRQGLVKALGEAAGAAYAALLMVPTTLYSQPQDVPTAMLHVLLGDMKSDGTIPHEDLIRKAAADHGVDLPAVPGKPLS
jgi:hypothetical protein